MKLPFAKMHGLGNDFVLLDGRRLPLPETPEEISDLARRMCERRRGVGADGLLLLLPSQVADVAMRMYNPDGTRAQMCGNGIRCLVAFARVRAVMPGPDGITVETDAGILPTRFITYNFTSMEGTVEIGMGVPRLERSAIPMLGMNADAEVIDQTLEVDDAPYRVTCVSMGNPHCVLFLDAQPGTPLEGLSLEQVPLERLGARLEKLPVFPERTNVEFAVVQADGSLRVRVWERGAGATEACGTGACACFVAAHRTNRIGRRGRVHLPGGALDIRWEKGGVVWMTGPYRWVFEGEWWEESDLFAP